MTISIIGQAGTFATIQAAVTAAANGATISVTAGTYTENVTITDKWVTIDGDKSGGAVNLNGQITVAGTLNGVLAITDLNINATGKPYGVFVSAASTNFAGSVLSTAWRSPTPSRTASPISVPSTGQLQLTPTRSARCRSSTARSATTRL